MGEDGAEMWLSAVESHQRALCMGVIIICVLNLQSLKVQKTKTTFPSEVFKVDGIENVS